jgi:UDP-glucose 4-epimerase
MQKAIVTGGAGFIGSHVVDALKDAGLDVTVVDYRVSPHRQDVGFENVDLMDMASVLSATKGADHIFHLAAISNVNYAHKYPVYTTALNVVGTANVLEAARVHGGIRVYLASTVWVYNGTPGNSVLDESTPFYLNGAGHIYSSSKIAGEMICHNYAELYKVPFTILRYGIPYGPRMREELLIPIFLKKALHGEPLTISGKGQQFRNFVYVRDMADAHVLAMGEKAINQTYNLEGRKKVTVLEVAEGIRRNVGDHVKIEFVPERPGDFGGKVISAEKAEKELGWKATVDFEEGLARTVRWFREKWNK